MKTLLTSALAIILLTSATQAEEGHDHDKVIPGPKGGKVVEVDSGHAEFLILPDKKVSVTFYDQEMKPTSPGEQVIAVVAEAPAGKAKLEFEKTTEAFVSTAALPDGDGYRLVLQVRSKPDGKMQNFRIDYHMEQCPECKRPEYACTCGDHGGKKDDGHGH